MGILVVPTYCPRFRPEVKSVKGSEREAVATSPKKRVAIARGLDTNEELMGGMGATAASIVFIIRSRPR